MCFLIFPTIYLTGVVRLDHPMGPTTFSHLLHTHPCFAFPEKLWSLNSPQIFFIAEREFRCCVEAMFWNVTSWSSFAKTVVESRSCCKVINTWSSCLKDSAIVVETNNELLQSTILEIILFSDGVLLYSQLRPTNIKIKNGSQ